MLRKYKTFDGTKLYILDLRIVIIQFQKSNSQKVAVLKSIYWVWKKRNEANA